MKNEISKIITLTNPILRGDKQITEITVTKPSVPALKGLKMFDVLQMDVDKADFATMEVADFTELSAAAVGFLGKNSETAEPTEE